MIVLATWLCPYIGPNQVEVKHFVRICAKYQNTKAIYKKTFGLYQLLPISNELWGNVSMYFMTQLLKWNGMDPILVVVDQFLKSTKMVLIKTTTTTFDTTKILFDMWVKHHNMP